MDPTTIANLALAALQAVLSIINSLKSQGALTDDQILAAAKQVGQDNDQLYQTLKAALSGPTNNPQAT